jgi:hypothetical protein
MTTTPSDYIDLHVAAGKKYLFIGVRQLAQMCADGEFKTAMKIGKGGKTSKWVVSRSEIIQKRINNHPNPYY